MVVYGNPAMQEGKGKKWRSAVGDFVLAEANHPVGFNFLQLTAAKADANLMQDGKTKVIQV